MKTTLLLVLATSLLVAAPALVDARHAGPCTHEYVDALRWGGPRAFVQTAQSCIKDDVCSVLDPCPLP